MGFEFLTLILKLLTQGAEIINFTVIGNVDAWAAIGQGHGLRRPIIKIDNRQPAMGKADPAIAGHP